MRRNATIKDVAARAGVSISVVSYVLNKTEGKSLSPETQRRVADAASALNYIPNRIAQGLRRRRSMCIGVVCCLDDRREHAGFVMSGINATASEHDYWVMTNLWNSRREFGYLESFSANAVDGLIFISPYEDMGIIDEAAHIGAMRAAKVPFVIINGHTFVDGVNYINYDFRGSARLATRHLISLGFREITYVTPELVHHELKERHRGYLDAIEETGLTPNVCLECRMPDRLKKMRAVVTNKSITAYGVIKEAERQGIRIPDDLALIAANTQGFSEYLSPPLSTVRLPAGEMGEQAARILIELINGRNPQKRLCGECVLELRKSC